MRRLSVCMMITAWTLGLVSWAQPARAAGGRVLTVAVAANFILPMGEIAERFQKATGIEVKPTFASTGKLYAQATAGAPYDLFLSADAARPQRLFSDGFCEAPFTYALGSAVLWTKDPALKGATSWREALAKAPASARIGISSPATAPYGAAAASALKATGLWETYEGRLVYAQSVAQAFQYGDQGSVALTFTAMSLALSEAGRKGTFWPIPEAPPIDQQACVLKRSADRAGAEALAKFLLSPEAKAILGKYGYRSGP